MHNHGFWATLTDRGFQCFGLRWRNNAKLVWMFVVCVHFCWLSDIFLQWTPQRFTQIPLCFPFKYMMLKNRFAASFISELDTWEGLETQSEWYCHRIGWWENFNRKALYLMVKTWGFRLRFSLKPIQWYCSLPIFLAFYYPISSRLRHVPRSTRVISQWSCQHVHARCPATTIYLVLAECSSTP